MVDAKSSTGYTTPVSDSKNTTTVPYSNDSNGMEASYPPTRSIVTVMLALYLSMFLVALVKVL